ncbi:MAG: dihydroorotase [Ilumatobacteraceae bacterium]|nr:dihydroorotase [Ilumatobacteraceae bacterium]
MTIVVKGGSVVGTNGVDSADVLVENDVIIKVGKNLTGDITLDASGCHIFPGFVDLHAHLREPGREDTETIETASRAGAKGGYTALIAMPNTNPAHDSVTVIEFVREQGRKAGLLDVFPSGCITMGRQGEALAPLAELSAAGVRIFTDDGSGVQDPVLMGRAMQYAISLGVTMAQHCEVSALTQGAVMNECGCSSDMGVPGWPAIAEEMMVQRDIEMSRITGASVHFLHLSTARSVDLVRDAKAEGLNVTAEVTPHHLSLTQELLTTFDPVYKVNPPLRSMKDIQALKVGLLDGTIDAVATDHAPHARRDKELTLDQAPPGMIGLETALGVVLSAVDLDPVQIAAVMSRNPARIAQITEQHGHNIGVGDIAHLCVVDLGATWQVDPSKLASKSRNTPFVGRQLRGMVRSTMYRGQITVQDGVAQK